MEEAWEDISLAPLNDHSPGTAISTINNNPTFPSMILQDFLSTPINKEIPPITSDCVPNGKSLAEETTLFGSLPLTSGTLLSSDSGSDFHTIESDNPLRQNLEIRGVATPSFGSSAVFPSFCKKRGQENKENSEDRRHKRKMKNRESAARSRARKQAYTNELELEVAHLLEENAKLRRQYEKFLAAPYQLPKKHTLSRTLTAPF